MTEHSLSNQATAVTEEQFPETNHVSKKQASGTPFHELLAGGQVHGSRVTSGYVLPLLMSPEHVFGPNASESQLDLQAFTHWLESHQGQLQETVLKHGAILFRGFTASDPQSFDLVRRALPYTPMPYVGGAAVRKVVYGEHLFTTNESPPTEPVPFHHELSQTVRPPDYITFFCQQAAQTGGETPLIDSRAIYRFMSDSFPQFTEKLDALGVKYVRVLPAEDDPSSAIGRSWPSTWQTQERAEAEQIMQAQGMDWEWLGSGNLKTVTRALPATRVDVRTGEKVFFNSMVAAFKGWIDSRNDPRYAVRFGDDSPLPCEVLEAIHEYMNEHKVSIPWQNGDILFIDNWVVMHARNPFEGPRVILAAIGLRSESDYAPS